TSYITIYLACQVPFICIRIFNLNTSVSHISIYIIKSSSYLYIFVYILTRSPSRILIQQFKHITYVCFSIRLITINIGGLAYSIRSFIYFTASLTVVISYVFIGSYMFISFITIARGLSLCITTLVFLSIAIITRASCNSYTVHFNIVTKYITNHSDFTFNSYLVSTVHFHYSILLLFSFNATFYTIHEIPFASVHS